MKIVGKARKLKEKLPVKIQMILHQLAKDIEDGGPVRGDWPHYSKLSDSEHHCHLKKGNPTYVAVWRESKNEIRLIEVIYAGSHEKAPIDDEMVTIRLRVRRSNASKIKSYAYSVESERGPSFTIEEVFPEYVGKEKQVALRAYRYREDLTQKQLADRTGIPQRHISEMETGKRPIGKENAKKLAEALNADYRLFL